jgi:hypothetical protein
MCLYTESSTAQLILLSLRRRCPFGYNLGSSSIEAATLLRVGEILNLEDLNFPILLDKRNDDEGVVVARGTVDEREHACGLRRVHTL